MHPTQCLRHGEHPQKVSSMFSCWFRLLAPTARACLLIPFTKEVPLVFFFFF